MRSLLAPSSAGRVVAVVVLLAGCSKPPKPPVVDLPPRITVAEPSGGPVTAKTAFAPLVKYATGWSGDVETLKLSPRDIPGFQIAEGKAAVWDATFASPSKHESRVYSYSVATVEPDIFKGIEALPAEPWDGTGSDAMPIDTSLFTVDSDTAYKAAAADAAEWLARNPKRPLTVLDLSSTGESHAPVWYVAWGDKKNGYTVAVNASTGTLYKK
jgi:hypothetical protein